LRFSSFLLASSVRIFRSASGSIRGQSISSDRSQILTGALTPNHGLESFQIGNYRLRLADCELFAD
jgi:hypothetical protein